MSNLCKVITTMGSASSLALILSGAAMAAPPTGFNTLGQWNVDTAGVVTATCPTGFTCATVANGSGFLQQEVTSNTAGGPRYVRTLIGEGFASTATTDITRLTFASEDYIQLGGAGGLASAMTIKEGTPPTTGMATAAADVTTGFSSSAQILAGASMVANAANKSEASLGLALYDTGAAATAGGDEFLTSFSVTADTTTAGVNVTNALGIDQIAYVGGTAATADRQRFVTLVENAVTAQTAFKFAANTTNPATLAWAIGDKIQVVWAGQSIGGAGDFSTESVIKVSTGAAVNGSNLTSPNTFEWTSTPATVLNTEFGTAPTF